MADTRSSAESARVFIQQLAALAERLAARNLVVASLECNWAGFGSWRVEVQNGDPADAYGEALLQQDFDSPGPHVIRFAWDGREGQLLVETAPTEPLGSPGPWERSLETRCDNWEKAIRFVEQYLQRGAAGEEKS